MMGVGSRRPPLPAPTDISSSAIGTSDDLATEVSRATDRTSYSIPEDGRPVTITTKKILSEREQSQTSLLIEYFEASKAGGGVHARPSVRVRVTPSGSKKNKTTGDHIQVTEVGRNRKPSYTRRISLPKSSSSEPLVPTEISEISDTSSGHAPIDIEVLQNVSDLSYRDQSPTRYMAPPSDISSMPPDSLLDGSSTLRSPYKGSSSIIRREANTMDSLEAPARRRSLSRERLVQKAAKKIQDTQGSSREAGGKGKHSRRSSRSESEYVLDEPRSPKTRSGKYRDDDYLGGSLQQSEISALSERSAGAYSTRSAASASSINNPKLLSAVEDAIKRLILPDLMAVKEEQARVKNRMKFEEITRDSMAPAGSRENLRRVSKSSSSPDVRRPGIISDDQGVIVPSESVKSKKGRRSSRESDRSRETVVRDESRKSSREKRQGKEALAAAATAAAAGALTAANLRHHDSVSSLDQDRERRRARSKSRSRTNSISETIEETSRKEPIPPLPMQSILDTELTRDSILSAETETERPLSRSSRGTRTPVREIREVSRGSPRQVVSPGPQTPVRSPVSQRRGVDTYHDNSPLISPASIKSDKSISAKAKAAGIAAAAGLTGAGILAANHTQHNEHTPTRGMSPAQSAASYRDDIDIAEHERIRSIKSAESIGSGRKAHRKRSTMSIDSMSSAPTTNLAQTKKRPDAISLERAYEVLPDNEPRPETPQAGEFDEWLEQEHERNQRYRHQLEEESQVGSSLVDRRRDTQYTDDSMGYEYEERDLDEGGQDVRAVGANPEYVRTPVAVESAVASLHDPSVISVQSSQKSASVNGAGPSQGDSFSRDINANAYSDQHPSSRRERWETIRDQAIATAREQAGTTSPRQSEVSMDERPVMGASALPLAGDDMMPEIGHGLEEGSEVTTNPSIIQGPIGGLEHGDRSHWPYEETPVMANGRGGAEDHHTRDAALLGAGAATVGLGLAGAKAREAGKQDTFANERGVSPMVEDVHDEEWQKPGVGRGIDALQNSNQQFGYASPTGNKIDEGYISGAVPGGELTPDPYATRGQDYDDASLGDYQDDEDPFTTQKHLRHESGLSHGMDSPLYDSATGKGIDRIQSKDVVALMDHLTVRDAQRNARDTEILVTLVRSAAEMRNQFEDMKKFIESQGHTIMQNTDRDADMTVQRLSGPRPLPTGSPRGARKASSEDSDDGPNKRRNVFRRALKGLSLKSGNDFAKIEGMLMQLLDEVEDLKTMQGGFGSQRAAPNGTQSTSLNSYDNNARASSDPGYEPEGQAGTSSSPAQSGHLSNPSSKHLSAGAGAMHSGYDGRRGSDGHQTHRISTVLEGDEEAEDWTPQSAPAASRSYDNEEPLLTPTQEARRGNSVPLDTPPEQSAPFAQTRSAEETPKTDKSRKHKSSTSSIFSNFPKISRWSKTTTSSAPDPESTRNSASKQAGRPYSQMSRSGSNLNVSEYDDYDAKSEDRLRSQRSFNSQSEGQTRSVRSPSPLIPEERHSMEDPKYQAHRNSLNLQHPQPRQGPTPRHQTYLESQAINYENPPTPDADHWGNTPALALNRNRYSGGSGQHQPKDLSPVYSEEDADAYSQHSASEQAHNRLPSQQQAPPRPPKVRSDEGPLVPPKVSLSSEENERSVASTSTAPAQPIGFGYSSPFSNSGMHIASPLEPIQEVRYSLETDRSSVRQQMTPSPRPTAMQTAQRKITPAGPRDMPRRGSPGGNSLNVRRKPVAAEQPQHDRSPASLQSYRDSFESETF